MKTTPSPANIANTGFAAIKAANILMSLAITASLGVLMIASLNCSVPVAPVSGIDREDSLAVAAIFSANQLPWPKDYGFIEISSEARVTRLTLYFKGIKVIPPDIRELTHLKTLQLGGNLLKDMPQEVENLTELTYLDLSSNQLDSLPDGFRLAHLAHLDLSRNRITALPTNIDVTGLVELALDSNRITSLPADFRYLTALVDLKLADNKLDSLPSGFGELRSLKRANLSHNGLKKLPASMAGMRLDYLNLGWNHLCFPDSAHADTSGTGMAVWLNEADRDWRSTQSCP